VRSNGGAFAGTQVAVFAGSPDVAVDPIGNAAVVWSDSTPGQSPRLATREYDITPPQIVSPAADLNPTAGDPASYSARATDDWSQPTLTWGFGDGSVAFGGSVSHIFRSPGSYDVALTVTDGADNTAVRHFSVKVAPGPTRGVDFNASQVSGTVFVSVPKSGHVSGKLLRRAVVREAAAIKPPKGYRAFRRLGANDNIPIGSIVDATRGVSELNMAVNKSATKRQRGRFSEGAFKVLQSKSSALTTAVLLGAGDFRKQCKAFGFLAKKRKRPHRRLFGSVKGRFRTRGRHSTATVRGTQWTMTDTCSGTLTVVKRGSVSVFDFGTHKTKVVRAGHRYLAHARKKR
jgi:hypothetical protein